MLSKEQTRLLEEIFDTSFYASGTINARKFRAQHEKLRDQIDSLEKLGFIKKSSNNNTEHYSLRLIALTKISNPQIDSLFVTMDEVFSYLRSCYINDPDAPVRYDEIALEIKTKVEEVHRLLSYMVDIPFYSSWTRNPMYMSSANIHIGERILDYQTFQQGVDELLEWAKNSQENLTKPQVSFSSLLKNKTPLPDSGKPSDQTLKWPTCGSKEALPILEEVTTAFENKLYALTVMGLRTVIDIIGHCCPV